MAPLLPNRVASSTTEGRSKANSGSVMVTVKKKKRTSRSGHAAATSPSPSSSSASSSITSGVPSCGGTTQKKKRARSDVGDADIVPAVRRRTSLYRGVSRHRASGKYEARLWDAQYCRSTTPMRKGKQVYLGAFNTEEAAARAYDLAALKIWGSECGLLNFPVKWYDQELTRMQGPSREEYLATLKRQSSGFTRGASKYRGVSRHHTKKHSRWEARIGLPEPSMKKKKYAYLGTYANQEEAARAYDLAAIQLHGLGAVTNFDIDSYRSHYLQPPLCNIDPDPEPTARPGQPPAPLLLQPKDGQVLCDDGAVADFLKALDMDPADFVSVYQPRQAWWPYDDDDVRDLPADIVFEGDIESVEFDTPGAASQGDAAAISCAAATISSLASGCWL